MYDIIIIGGGTAGMCAAVAARDSGVKNLLLLERGEQLGGESNELREAMAAKGIPYRTQTIARRLTTTKTVTAEGRDHGRYLLEARAIILATGGRSLPDLSLPLPDCTLADGAHLLTDPATGGTVVDQSRQSEIEGIFVCGNALHPHDTKKTAAREGEIAGRAAAALIQGKARPKKSLRLVTEGLAYAVPQCITALTRVTLYLRPSATIDLGRIRIRDGENVLWDRIESDLSPDRLLSIILTATSLRTVRGDTLSVTLEPLT